MTNEPVVHTRRAAIGAGLAALAAAPAVARQATRSWQRGASPWPLCLDTATIRPASLEDKVRIAAETGFDAIEPWDGELAEYERNGGHLADLGKKIRDRGLFVPSVIGLWDAIPPTREAWDAGLPATRNRLRMAAAIGSQHVQVIPGPPREAKDFDAKWAADRYRDLLEIGLGEFGVNPAMVFVAFLPGARRFGQAAAIALDADHPKAKIIPDVFHMHIGGSGFSGLKHVRGSLIAIFQFNDAPATPSIEKLEDKHRVYPGDGILPLGECLRDLRASGFDGCVSLELYNEEYWKQDLKTVAETGKRKSLEVIAKAFA